jgi:carbamoyltransferase
MSRLVLGINSAHPDAAAVLASDKGIVAAICEERINRRKHCAGFPSLAIAEVLKIAGADITDITDIAIARDSRANLLRKGMFMLRHPRSGLGLAQWSFGVHKRLARALELVAEATGVAPDRIRAAFHRVEHHVAHAASSFFCSDFERAVAVTTDGVGDFCTGLIARCEGNRIEVLAKNHWPHSFGVFYTAITNFLGFNKYGEEYKVMGMAAYGQPVYLEAMRRLVSYSPQGGMRLNLPYYNHHYTVHTHTETEEGEIVVKPMWSERIRELLGEPRERKAAYEQRHRDLAASLQRGFEEVYMAYVDDAVRRTGLRDAVLAGGCALNGVGNGRLMMEGHLDRVYIHPAAGDDGTASGAALYTLHSILGVPRAGKMNHAYLGTSWTDDQIERDARASGLPYQRLDRERLVETAASALSQGKVVGWFQGREEWGPRALGNRSILCHPGWPDMKAILNARVKNREPFRPFAPCVKLERLSECFEGSHEVPFMNIVYKVRPEWRQRLSATTHEDNTGRVQTVSREQNPLYYDLIDAFERRTGVPVLLNTSFNENEPIVHTPAQAIGCFARTRMDCLGIGGLWFEKPQGLKEEQV